MIINLRGTHGSGKSTVVTTILRLFGAEPLGAGRRPEGYRVEVSRLRRPVYVVGPYTSACGGCDAIQPYDLIWPRVVAYAALGHVLFEGALVSSSYGNIGRASEAYGDRFVFGFMDTPLEVCLGRIAARRAARGDTRPLDPRNTAVKFTNAAKSATKIRALGRRVVTIDHTAAVTQVLGMLAAGDREERADE